LLQAYQIVALNHLGEPIERRETAAASLSDVMARLAAFGANGHRFQVWREGRLLWEGSRPRRDFRRQLAEIWPSLDWPAFGGMSGWRGERPTNA
jgi:hypothetical protein